MYLFITEISEKCAKNLFLSFFLFFPYLKMAKLQKKKTNWGKFTFQKFPKLELRKLTYQKISNLQLGKTYFPEISKIRAAQYFFPSFVLFFPFLICKIWFSPLMTSKHSFRGHVKHTGLLPPFINIFDTITASFVAMLPWY